MANGHSLRMATALLVLPAGPSSLLPIRTLVVCGRQGCGCPARALTRARFSQWFAGSSWTRQGFVCPYVVHCGRVSRLTLFSETGNVAGVWAVRTLSRLVCACALLCVSLEVLLECSRFCPLGARF